MNFGPRATLEAAVLVSLQSDEQQELQQKVGEKEQKTKNKKPNPNP